MEIGQIILQYWVFSLFFWISDISYLSITLILSIIIFFVIGAGWERVGKYFQHRQDQWMSPVLHPSLLGHEMLTSCLICRQKKSNNKNSNVFLLLLILF